MEELGAKNGESYRELSMLKALVIEGQGRACGKVKTETVRGLMKSPPHTTWRSIAELASMHIADVSAVKGKVRVTVSLVVQQHEEC